MFPQNLAYGGVNNKGEDMNIVSFSGGKDSTAMLLMMLERGITVDRVICVDTTKEFPQMYEHIKKIQAMISPIEIEIVKIDFDYWFSERPTKKGNNGYGWPFFRVRWCTGLKKRAFASIAKNLNYNPRDDSADSGSVALGTNIVEYHGIAYDEKQRVSEYNKRNIKYPLIDFGITENNALEYCYSRGLNWGGLYEKLHRVSCWCCPMARIGNLRVLHNEFPELWAQLIEMDKKSFRKFRYDYSVDDLTKKFGSCL